MTEEQVYNTLSRQVAAIFASHTITVISIEGEKIYDKSSFLQEFAIKFHFPSYFGNNWDAFYDCLTDLEWFDVKNTLVIYPHSTVFKTSCPEDWRIALDILFDAVDYWKQRRILLSILFL